MYSDGCPAGSTKVKKLCINFIVSAEVIYIHKISRELNKISKISFNTF